MLPPASQALDHMALTSKAADLFRAQPAAEQRKLLRLVVQEASWKGGELRTSLSEPFEVLRLSNQANNNVSSGFGGERIEFGIWRRGGDSNPR